MRNKLELNAQTGEAIVRELNADELAQFELDIVKAKARADEKIAKDVAREKLLTKLGITSDEAKLLLG